MSEKTASVCVIEDMKPIRTLLCTVLQKAGFDTVEFADGKSSIEWLESNIPQAVVMDILLPDINGTEILNYIRQQPGGPDVPVIAVTGFAQVSDREKYIDLGFDSYVAKPINTATFPNEIRSVIDSKK